MNTVFQEAETIIHLAIINTPCTCVLQHGGATSGWQMEEALCEATSRGVSLIILTAPRRKTPIPK